MSQLVRKPSLKEIGAVTKKWHAKKFIDPPLRMNLKLPSSHVVIEYLNVITSEGYGKCVPILEHFEEKNVANAKYASRRLQSPRKRAQSTEHILIID